MITNWYYGICQWKWDTYLIKLSSNRISLFNCFLRVIDPDGIGQWRRLWQFVFESFRMQIKGRHKGIGSILKDSLRCSVVNVFWYHHADTRMVMAGVIPDEKVLAKSSAILDRSKGTWKLRAVLEGFELCLGKRIVIAPLCDPIYQRCRTKFSSRKEYWNQLRCTFRVLCFNNWEHMLNFIWNPPEIRPPPD